MPASVQSPPTHRQFGKYLLDEEIARGGMARVYLARLRGLGGFEKRLVVKQVLPELATDPRFIEMFVEEAKTLVQMSHPHIVPVYELGVVDGVYFLAMEFVDGATLAEILGDGPLTPTLAAHLGMQVCDALSYAHERFELVHRDVTPRNVIVDSLGHVSLLDFGIAARAEGTLVGEVFGSHGYMSPEQARGEVVSASSDLFSLGTVLYEALTNRPAFLRESPDQTRAALLEGDRPSLRADDEVPEALAALIAEALTADPDRRPPSAKHVGKRLRSFLATNAPEGVAPELGDRALSATKNRNRTPSQAPPSIEGDTPARATIRTIATSVTLRRMLGDDSSDSPDAPGGAVPTPTVEPEALGTAGPGSDQDGTLPIPGRTSSQDGTVPIPGRTPSQDGTLPVTRGASEQSATQPSVRPPEAKPPARLALVAIGLVAALLSIVGYRLATDPSSSTGAGDAGDLGDAGARVAVAATADAEAAGGGAAGGGADAGTQDTDAGADARADADADADAAVDAGQGEDAPSRPELRVPVAQPARISISAQPWGEYRLDRATLGTEAVRDRVLTPGRHTLRITNDSLGKSAEATFEASAGEALRALVNFNDEQPSIRITRSRAP